MKTSIKCILSFVAGGAAGAGTVFYILKKKFEDQVAEEADKLKNYYESTCNSRYEAMIEELQNRIVLLEGGVEPQKEEKKTTKKSKKAAAPKDVAVKDDEITQKIDYNAISKEEPKKVKHVKSTVKGPQIISFEEYSSDKKHEKIFYTYLDKEDMILDENNEPVVDAEDEIGTDYKEIDNGPDGDNRYVYVRNDSVGRDFEIAINVYDTYEQFLAEEES